MQKIVSPVVVSAVLLGLAVGAAGSGTMNEAKLRTLLQTLSYDKNLASERAGGFRIGVVSLAGSPDSKSAASGVMAAVRALGDQKVGGLPVAWVPVPVADVRELEAAVRARRLNAMFLCSGLGDLTRPLIAFARSHRLLVMTGELAHVEAGAAVGFLPAGGRVQIVLNPEAARAQGASFDSRILRLARIVSTIQAGKGRSDEEDDLGGEFGLMGDEAAAALYQTPEVIKGRRIAGDEPEYPKVARVARISATLIVKLYIDPEGKVTNVKFLKTHEVFEPAIRKALETWKFSPHLVNDRPVGTYTVYKFEFRPR